ncbi:hypothetical protein EVAR_38483_1 [Eumeta japonica]|uniref:Uncharacterized protein n=1 Tax=Eumeta variegata TaxID=151549 RepID=A0A4C1WLJ9_EUMVA|nr:hypothetical protein EVAR_38483_1 [Eumeta japonica]
MRMRHVAVVCLTPYDYSLWSLRKLDLGVWSRDARVKVLRFASARLGTGRVVDFEPQGTYWFRLLTVDSSNNIPSQINDHSPRASEHTLIRGRGHRNNEKNL